MNCGKCGGEMKTVTLMSGPGYWPYLSYKKKGIFEGEKRSPVDCRVCVQCGTVELCARNPEAFRDI